MTVHKRKIQDQIGKWLDTSDPILVLGPRRVGKTTLLKLLFDDIQEKWGDTKEIVLFDAEDPDSLYDLNRAPKYFKDYCLFSGADPDKDLVVLIDEIQNLEDPAGFLSCVAETEPSIKIIGAGSTSLSVKNNSRSIPQSLQLIHLFPLDFEEFLRFKRQQDLCAVKNHLNYQNFAKDSEVIETRQVQSVHFEMSMLFEEFILYGGYPQVVLATSKDEKMNQLKQLMQIFELKGVNVFFNVVNMNTFRSFLKIIAGDTGKLFNVNALSRTLKIGRDTVRRYLAILEQSFMVNTLMPFHSNHAKELTKMPKVFFGDTGLRNFAIHNFTELQFRPDKEQLFENTICCELVKNLGREECLYFWRTIARNEIDFVLTGKHNMAFDVKADSNAYVKKSSGFRAFNKYYTNFKQFIVNFEEFSHQTETTCLPGWMV